MNEKDTRESVCLQFASSISSARDGRSRGPLQQQQQNSAHSPTGRIRTVLVGLGGEECYTLSLSRKYELGSNLKIVAREAFCELHTWPRSISHFTVTVVIGARAHLPRDHGKRSVVEVEAMGWGFVMRSRNHLYQLSANGDRVRVTKCPSYTDAAVILFILQIVHCDCARAKTLHARGR